MRLAADTNDLLAAVLGGRARSILECPQIEDVPSVEQIIAEVQEYAVHLASEKGPSEDLVLLAVGALPVRIVARTEYNSFVGEAGRHEVDGSDARPVASPGCLRRLFFLRLSCDFCRALPRFTELSC